MPRSKGPIIEAGVGGASAKLSLTAGPLLREEPLGDSRGALAEV